MRTDERIIVGVCVVLALVMVNVSSCQAKDKDAFYFGKNEVQFSMTSKVVTNEVNESEYNIQVNGYRKVDELGRAWANNIILSSFAMSFTNICYQTNTIPAVHWVSVNQSVVNPPDPFQEKVTVKYFIVLREDTYTLHVGPLQTDFAVVKTVLKRWKTRHVQKLNMIEHTEKVNE